MSDYSPDPLFCFFYSHYRERQHYIAFGEFSCHASELDKDYFRTYHPCLLSPADLKPHINHNGRSLTILEDLVVAAVFLLVFLFINNIKYIFENWKAIFAVSLISIFILYLLFGKKTRIKNDVSSINQMNNLDKMDIRDNLSSINDRNYKFMNNRLMRKKSMGRNNFGAN